MKLTMQGRATPRADRRRSLRPVALAVAALAANGAAWALPQGGTVTQGQASIGTAGSRMDIRQSSRGATIDWRGFSIGAGETVRIQQPDAKAVLLNRVSGVSPSVLLGRLEANGKVYLSNPRGIVFGAGGQVDVGSLVATTLAIDDAALQAGRFELTRGLEGAGAIEVGGEIRAAGTVALVAPTIDVAAGARIVAPRVGLAAASAATVDVEGDGLVFFHLRGDDLPTRLRLLGEVRADGGSAELRAAARAGVVDTVLNLDGIVQARSLGVREGRVVIDGGAAGVVAVGGQVDARGTQPGERGGAVDVLGDRIALAPTARIDASGEAGGGRIRVGGDYQGANAEVANAKRVVVQAGAVLAADAVREGPGGRVIVWSDEATAFVGTIHARGGASGGDGGFAEVSSKGLLDFRGQAVLSAPRGAAGRLLLDPLNITIGGVDDVNGDSTPGDDLGGALLAYTDFSGASSQITAGAVKSQLETGGGTTVELQATNDINVTSPMNALSGRLILRAGNSISVGVAFNVAGGLELHANNPASGPAANTGAVTIGGVINNGSGALLIDGHGSGGTHAINQAVTAGTLTLRGNTTASGALTVGSVVVESGTLTLGAADRIANTAAVTVAAGAGLGLGAFSDTVGSLSLAGTLGGSGTLTAATYGLNGATVNANLGAGALTSTGTSRITGNAGVTTAVVQSGSLTVGNGGAGGSLGGSKTVNAGATLVYDVSGAVALGAVGGAGSVEQAGSGTLTIDQAANVSALNVTGSGTLALGASNLVADGTPVAVGAGGRFDLAGFSDTIGSLSLSGTLSGSGTLTAATYAVTGGTVNANLGAGALTSTGTSRITGNAGVTSALVQSGTLTVGNGGAGGTLGGSKTVNAGATLVYDVSGPVTLGAVGGTGSVEQAGSGTLTIDQAVNVAAVSVTGNGTVALGASNLLADGTSVTVGASGRFDLAGFSDTVGSLSLSGTLAGSGTLSAATYTLAGATVDGNLGAGALSSTGSTTLNGTVGAGSVAVNGGTLALGAANRLADGAAVAVATGAVLNLGANSDTVGSLTLSGSLNGSGTLTAATYTLTGGTVNANLGAGALTSSGNSTLNGTAGAGAVGVSGGTLVLGPAASLLAGAAVTVDSGAALDLGASSHTVLSLSLAGTLNGGALTALTYALNGGTVNANLGPGALTSNGSSQITGNANVTTAVVQSGTLTVGNGGAGGTLGGSKTVDAGGTLRLNVNGPLALGAVGGTGTVEQAGSGTLTIDQAVNVSALNVTGSGTALLGAPGVLSTSTAVGVGSAGTFDIAGFSGTLGSLTLAGTLNGSGTLTAATYALNGGTVNANLGTGALTSAGNSTLNGTVGAGTVGVAGGTLSLGASDRLANTAAVTVASGAVLNLGANSDTVGSLALSGSLNGSGTLTAGTYALNGGTVNANLGAGALTSSGNSTLNGAAGAGTVGVTGGTLTLGASDRLADTAVVTVASGAVLNLGANNDTVGSLALSGSLNGSGTLSAGTYGLTSGTANANLGAGALTSTGNSTLNGTAGAGTVAVNGGTLSLGASNRLADAAAVTVAAGAVLNLGANSDTVGSLTLSGSVNGSGTLTAATYALSGGTVNANLGAGALTSTGSSTLNGTAGAGSVGVTGGTLSLGASNRLADGAALTVASGAVLNLGANSDTVGSLALAGTLAGSGTLSAATYALDGGTVDAKLGAGALSSTGSSRLNGTAAVASVDVSTGSLAVAATGSFTAAPLATVQAGASLLADGDLTLGTLAGAGTVGWNGLLAIGSGGSSRFDGTLSGPGGLRKEGAASTFTLGGSAGYGGPTEVAAGTLVLETSIASTDVQVRNGGVLALAAGDRLADGATVGVDNGGRLSLGAFSDTVSALQLSGTVDGSGTLSATTYALHAGALVQANLGAGTLTSDGASRLEGESAAGIVQVTAGRLTLATAERLADNAVVGIDAGASIALGGNETIGSLAGAGDLVLGGFTLATGGAGDSRFDGRLLGGALVKQGGGRFVLGGANTLDDTTIDAGTLVAASNAALGAGPVHNAGVLRFETGGSVVLPGAIDGAGVVEIGGASTLRLGADNRHAGGTRIEAGSTVQLADGGTLGSGEVANDGVLQVDRSSALVLANRIVGAGALEVTGGGALTLTADNTYAGATRIAAGATLQLGDGGASGTVGAGDVALAGTLRLVRSDAFTLANRLDGAGTLVQAGSGTVTLTGANTLSGATVVAAGTLEVGDGGTRGAIGSGAVRNDGTLRWRRSDDVDVVGKVSGGGALEQAGSGTLRLLADNDYTGPTRIAAGGTLQVGDGGARGALGSGDVANDGTLRLARSDDATLAQAITGNGALEQAGTGTLTLASAGNTYAGGTRVRSGRLATAGDDRLPDSGLVQVDAGAALLLAGQETLGSLEAAGDVTLRGSLAAGGRLLFAAGLKIDAAGPVLLRATEIVAETGDHDFGAQPLSIAADSVRLLSGQGTLDAPTGNTYRDLTLGSVSLTQGGRIDALKLQLDGPLALDTAGAALELRAYAAPGTPRPVDLLVGPNAEPLALSEVVVRQGTAGTIQTVAGSTLTVKTVNGGSVDLERDGNVFDGGLSVLTGGAAFGIAWRQNGGGSPLVARQDEVRVAAQRLVVGGGSGTAVNGIESDVVYLRAGQLFTEGPGIVAARLPYNNLLVGSARSLPALTLEMTDAAFTNTQTRYTFGDPNGNREIAVQLGARDTGARPDGLNAGFVRVLPAGGARGSTAVYLKGPAVGGAGAYSFFDSGAGQLSEIPVLYNGYLPSSPQLQGSLSSVAAVSEQARKERFEEAVRTENVAVRLRGGVIAEVGPGRPATHGTEGIRLPPQCDAVKDLACRVE